MRQDHGRIDWMARAKVWKVIGYMGNKDIEIGRNADREEAIKVLTNYSQWRIMLRNVEKSKGREEGR